MGWSLLALQRYQEAHDQMKKALQIEPYDQRILAIAGEALYYLGKNSDALKHFEQYVSIAPGGRHISTVYFLMGEIYIRLGQYNNADISLSTALHFDNRDARWWARLGYARELNEDYAWAQQAYENALKLNPNLVEATRGLESVRKKLNQG
jgi:tetratricopeptide (TPR) repeat protein